MYNTYITFARSGQNFYYSGVMRAGPRCFCTRLTGYLMTLYTFAEDYGETTVLKREAGEKPELCPQRYVL